MKPEQHIAIIQKTCADEGLMLADRQLDQLVRYGELLESANRKTNLVSRKEQAPLLMRHIFHSLLIGLFHPFQPDEKVLDIGTGGGLPGIPLAIAFPDTRFLLIDATGKKISACNDMIASLELKNVIAKKNKSGRVKGSIL